MNRMWGWALVTYHVSCSCSRELFPEAEDAENSHCFPRGPDEGISAEYRGYIPYKNNHSSQQSLKKYLYQEALTKGFISNKGVSGEELMSFTTTTTLHIPTQWSKSMHAVAMDVGVVHWRSISVLNFMLLQQPSFLRNNKNIEKIMNKNLELLHAGCARVCANTWQEQNNRWKHRRGKQWQETVTCVVMEKGTEGVPRCTVYSLLKSLFFFLVLLIFSSLEMMDILFPPLF